MKSGCTEMNRKENRETSALVPIDAVEIIVYTQRAHEYENPQIN